MNKRQFKYGMARNFLCFGNEGVEIDFTKLGNIVYIQGINHDSDIANISSNGSGKCFGKNTSIMMADGTSKLVQDIEVKDQVMGIDSAPRNVLNVTKGVGELFMVTPIRGWPYIVNGDHVLCLKAKYELSLQKKTTMKMI